LQTAASAWRSLPVQAAGRALLRMCQHIRTPALYVRVICTPAVCACVLLLAAAALCIWRKAPVHTHKLWWFHGIGAKVVPPFDSMQAMVVPQHASHVGATACKPQLGACAGPSHRHSPCCCLDLQCLCCLCTATMHSCLPGSTCTARLAAGCRIVPCTSECMADPACSDVAGLQQCSSQTAQQADRWLVSSAAAAAAAAAGSWHLGSKRCSSRKQGLGCCQLRSMLSCQVTRWG
jgi:hypothetical protein